jgi:hypothetical protein
MITFDETEPLRKKSFAFLLNENFAREERDAGFHSTESIFFHVLFWNIEEYAKTQR